MTLQDDLKEYYSWKEKEKEAKEALAAMSESILEQLGDEPVEVDGVKFSKVYKRIPKLREDADVIEIRTQFPESVEYKVDVKVLEKIPDAHKYLTLSESTYILTKNNNGKKESTGTV